MTTDSRLAEIELALNSDWDNAAPSLISVRDGAWMMARIRTLEAENERLRAQLEQRGDDDWGGCENCGKLYKSEDEAVNMGDVYFCATCAAEAVEALSQARGIVCAVAEWDAIENKWMVHLQAKKIHQTVHAIVEKHQALAGAL